MMAQVRSNPFATRFTRPGAIAPLDASGQPVDIPSLLRRFERLGSCALIRGPHGSGKSTLLLAIIGCLAQTGRFGGHLRLGHGWRRDFLAVIGGLASCGRGRVLCIDGWERLGFAAATAIHGMALGCGRGLLVTSHRDGPMATLVECTTTPELLERIVNLLPDHGGRIVDVDIRRAFDASLGNLREALFALYDRFETAGDSTRIGRVA